jgi:hypothetical protein
MGANNFIAFATVPAGAGVGPKTSVDLWTLVPSTGLDPGFNVMCTGEFVGTITVEGSLDGAQFNPVGFFTLGSGQLVGPFEPTFELAPIVVDDVVRYLRLRVMPGTTVTGPVFVTAGGGANCDCSGGGAGPSPYDLDPEPVDSTQVGPGVSADYARGDHVHGLADIVGDLIIGGDVVVFGRALATDFIDLVATDGARMSQGFQSGDDSQVDGNFLVTETLTVDGLSSIVVLQMGDGSAAPVSVAGKAAIRYNLGTDMIQYSKNGGAWTNLI